MWFPKEVFFKPTDKFIKFIKEQNRGVIEFGAGSGYLGSKLIEQGIGYIGYDTVRRDNYFSPVVITDALTVALQQDKIVVIARPNEGVWVEQSIQKCRKNKIPHILVSCLDLSYFPFIKPNKILSKVGEDYEYAYISINKKLG